MAKLYSPTGVPIIGTYEELEGVANINGATLDDSPNAPAKYDLDWQGSTDVWWDGQRTKLNKKGERLFIDENGDSWPESKLVLKD